MNEKLKQMVIEQFGDEDYFYQCAEDIRNHGADGGWNGFTYYSDTVLFGEKIRALVKPILQDYADDFYNGGIFSMMKSFKYLTNWTVDEIAEGWFNNDDEAAHVAVMNALSWFALEEVARAVVAEREQEVK